MVINPEQVHVVLTIPGPIVDGPIHTIEAIDPHLEGDSYIPPVRQFPLNARDVNVAFNRAYPIALQVLSSIINAPSLREAGYIMSPYDIANWVSILLTFYGPHSTHLKPYNTIPMSPYSDASEWIEFSRESIGAHVLRVADSTRMLLEALQKYMSVNFNIDTLVHVAASIHDVGKLKTCPPFTNNRWEDREALRFEMIEHVKNSLALAASFISIEIPGLDRKTLELRKKYQKVCAAVIANHHWHDGYWDPDMSSFSEKVKRNLHSLQDKNDDEAFGLLRKWINDQNSLEQVATIITLLLSIADVVDAFTHRSYIVANDKFEVALSHLTANGYPRFLIEIARDTLGYWASNPREYHEEVMISAIEQTYNAPFHLPAAVTDSVNRTVRAGLRRRSVNG